MRLGKEEDGMFCQIQFKYWISFEHWMYPIKQEEDDEDETGY